MIMVLCNINIYNALVWKTKLSNAFRKRRSLYCSERDRPARLLLPGISPRNSQRFISSI